MNSLLDTVSQWLYELLSVYTILICNVLSIHPDIYMRCVQVCLP